MLRPIMHVFLHFAVPGLVAWLFFRSRWWWVWLLMLSTMLIDLDHLLAVPVFDPNRARLGGGDWLSGPDDQAGWPGFWGGADAAPGY